MTTGVFNPLTDIQPAQIKGPKLVAKKPKTSGLCPVCGEKITIIGTTEDGRLVGSCFDAFTTKKWTSK